MVLDEKFAVLVSAAIEELWEASIIMRVTRCCWARTKDDAVTYCIDHERFCERNPEVARLIHNAIDLYGHDRVAQYLAEHVNLMLNPRGLKI